ncbi:branched-chain amino acid ABC transporter permease (plasmid) [Aminobacter sp. NyZ550]|jgi:branched-chain amino acid transport system permease protein|uniref:Branched-chain amino acid ABC-type transport system, permease component n=2 Tax=Aminobacter TaxID=31988 RepID=A0A142MDS1_AMIAI|nr:MULTISPECIES: branched-chain amino acid ABC transporter permease [Aminobacter]AMS44491.1 Branched-chain amino acid ABC-type transport system, permease component [Aminobacter aminovorans]MBA8907741.1 branched-chain amino acid transport system permease protein [Aminobacter ciceronei]MBA9021409.1 branched-chain amino acid transport system permease protein [Aminobacter ciceronei]MBB3704233.1 branched-chain amino acid transport system permease protein [Aminobacter aminovorans]MRX32523.1 branched
MTQVMLNALVVGTTYALIALGITIIFSIMKVVNFAHGQLYMIGGFVVYYFNVVFGLPFWFGLVMSFLIVGLLGVAMELFLFRPVMLRVKREEVTMLLAMGTAVFLESLALIVFGEKQRGVPPIATGVIEVFDARLPTGRIVVIVVAAMLIAALMAFIGYTKTGRALRAMAQDREATALQGVNLKWLSAMGFGLGTGLAGLSGGLLVAIFAVHTGAGTAISIKAFLMIMIGGAGVLSGAILGGFVLGFLESVGYALLPGSLTFLIIFLIVICFLIVRPNGIMGKPWG